MGKESWFSWGARIVVAFILIQSVYFKLTAQTVSVELFSILGVESWGRITLGIVELITGILILISPTVFIGAILATLIGLGAILTHLFFIGINFDGDITLFLMAIVVFGLSIFLIWSEKRKKKLVFGFSR